MYNLEKNGEYYLKLLGQECLNGNEYFGFDRFEKIMDNLLSSFGRRKMELDFGEEVSEDSNIDVLKNLSEAADAFDYLGNLEDKIENPYLVQHYNDLKKMVIADTKTFLDEYFGKDDKGKYAEPAEEDDLHALYETCTKFIGYGKDEAVNNSILDNKTDVSQQLLFYSNQVKQVDKGVYNGSKEFNELREQIDSAVKLIEGADETTVEKTLISLKEKAGEYLDKKYGESGIDMADEVKLQDRMKLALSIYNYANDELSQKPGYDGGVYKPMDNLETVEKFDDFKKFLASAGLDIRLDSELARVCILPDTTSNTLNSLDGNENYSLGLTAENNSLAKMNQVLRAYSEGRLFLEGDENKLIVPDKNYDYSLFDMTTARSQVVEIEKAFEAQNKEQNGERIEEAVPKYEDLVNELDYSTEQMEAHMARGDVLTAISASKNNIELKDFSNKLHDLTGFRGSSDAYRAVEDQLKDYMAVSGKLDKESKNLLLENTKRLIKNYMDGKTDNDLKKPYTQKRYSAMLNLDRHIDKMIEANKAAGRERTKPKLTPADRRVLVNQSNRVLKNCGFSLENFAMLKSASLQLDDLRHAMTVFMKKPGIDIMKNKLDGEKLSLRQMDSCYCTLVDTTEKLKNARNDGRALLYTEVNNTGIEKFDSEIRRVIDKSNNIVAPKDKQPHIQKQQGGMQLQ